MSGAQIVALPIFDCVVVKASAEKAVTGIMKGKFKAITGLDIGVKLERSTARSSGLGSIE